jgi:glycosyltransferase involved in cell wall biosynthesis
VDTPQVTVLMSVYNGEKYLRQAVDSVLAQTFRDFELLIVDDCSTDSTAEILKSYHDSRIRIVSNNENSGPYKSAQIGLGLARGKYVARLDADDIALPNRLEKQYARLESEPDLAVCASSYEVIDENGDVKRIAKAYFSGDKLYYYLSFANFLAHSTVLFRRDAILALGGYDETLRAAGDYDLWHRVSRVAKMVRMEDVLVKWREHSESISSTDTKKQTGIARSTAFNWIDRICNHRLDREVISVLCEWSRAVPFFEVKPDAMINGLILLNKRLIALAPEYVDRKKLRELGWQLVYRYVVIAFRQRRILSLLSTVWTNLLDGDYVMLLVKGLAGAVYRRLRGDM